MSAYLHVPQRVYPELVILCTMDFYATGVSSYPFEPNLIEMPLAPLRLARTVNPGAKLTLNRSSLLARCIRGLSLVLFGKAANLD